MADDVEEEQLIKLRKVCDRLYELVRKKRYVDMTIILHNGEIRLWEENTKHKP